MSIKNEEDVKEIEIEKEDNFEKENNLEKEVQAERVVKNIHAQDSIRRRYRTIDLIMGIAVISIVFSSGIGVVGELPAFLGFSKWNGITFGDLGLPLLLFCICFLIPSEIEFDLKKKKSFKDIVLKKISIGIVLFLIGLVINLIEAKNFNSFRIMGILQLISIVYMICSLIYIVFRKFNFKTTVIATFLIIIGLLGLVGYYFVGAKFGNNLNTCLAYFVDSKVMPGHFGDFERYGIIATASAMFYGCLAAAGGSFLCNRRVEERDKINRILILGMLFVIIALLMEKSCPYNANILSPSFMMIVLGGCFVVFSALFGVFDLNRSKFSNLLSFPFVVMGSSAVFVVGLNELIRNTLFSIKINSISRGCWLGLDKWMVLDLFSDIFGSGSRTIGFIIIYLMIIFCMMLYLYAKRIFIRFK